MLFDEGVSTFRLQHGQSAMARKIPCGVRYKLEEYDDSAGDYTTTIDGEQGVISTTLSEAISISTRDRGSYKYVHEYYVKDRNGNLTLEGTSEIGSSADDLLVDDNVHYTDEGIEKVPEFEDNVYEYQDTVYGRMTEDDSYIVDNDMSYVVVTESGEQVVILQYVREEPVKYGSYQVRREYYVEDADGTLVKVADVKMPDITDLVIDDSLHYTAELHDKPEYYTCKIDGKSIEFSWMGDAYGVDDGENPDMKYVVATEDGNQVVILKYVYKEQQVIPPEEPEVFGSYQYVHEYYTIDADGNRVLDGRTDIGVVDGLELDDMMYTSNTVEKLPEYQGVVYDYEGSDYGTVNENGYAADADMTSVVATESGNQIIILQYVRTLEPVIPPEEPVGFYRYVHEYYTKMLSGETVFDGRTDILSSDKNLSLDDDVTYDASDVEIREQYDGKDYVYDSAVYGLMDDVDYDVDETMSYVMATETGEQVIVLRYMRDEVPEEPDVYGSYQYIHEYYTEDVDGNRVFDGRSDMMSVSDLLVNDDVHYDSDNVEKQLVYGEHEYVYEDAAYGVVNGDSYDVSDAMSYVVATESGGQVIVLRYVKKEIPKEPEFGTYKWIHEYYFEDVDGNRKLEGTSELMSSNDLVLDDSVHYTGDDIEKVLSYNVDGKVYEYTYDKSVYGLMDADKYAVDSEMSYVVTTKDGVQVIVLQYVRKSVSKPEEPKFGSIVVSKRVTGDGDKFRDFEFVLVLDDTSVNGTYGDLIFEDGKAVFTLKDGESKLADGLPVGISYEVTETVVEGYTTTSKNEKGMISEGLTVVEFVNDLQTKDVLEKPDELKPEDPKNPENPGPDTKEPPKTDEKPVLKVPDDKVPTNNQKVDATGKVSEHIQTSDTGNLTMWTIVLLLIVVSFVSTFVKGYRKE